jgi:tetratricopeptide (TPR) repeat protein
VFSGGWSLTAAETVCKADSGRLASLVEKSLVLEREPLDEEPRFDMLETIREYAGERLEARPDAAAVRARHAELYLGLAEQAEDHLDTGDMSAWLIRLDHDHDNERAALAWFVQVGDVERELRLVTALKNYWWVRGLFAEGRRALGDALGRGQDAPPRLRADALTAIAVIGYRQGALDVAQAAWQESLELYRELGDSTGFARSVGELGSVAVAEGDYERAAELYEESAALFRADGDTMRLASVIGNLGAIANMQGDYVRGRALCEEALALHREVGAKDDIALTLQNLGRVALHEQRLTDALELLQESLEVSRELGYREMIAYGLEGWAELDAALGHDERAARMLGAADALFEELGVALQKDDRETYDRVVEELRERLGEDALGAARLAGRTLGLEEAIEEAFGSRAR